LIRKDKYIKTEINQQNLAKNNYLSIKNTGDAISQIDKSATKILKDL